MSRPILGWRCAPRPAVVVAQVAIAAALACASCTQLLPGTDHAYIPDPGCDETESCCDRDACADAAGPTDAAADDAEARDAGTVGDGRVASPDADDGADADP